MADQVYTVTQALEKAMKYCAYQERCQSEVRQKLRQFQITSDQREEVISLLIQQDFLNEERFSQAYARGKFRMNHWGKKKIKLALKQKDISEYCIKKGIQEIEESEYSEVLTNLIEKTYEKNRGTQEYKRVAKTAQYVIGRGFEADLVWNEIKQLTND